MPCLLLAALLLALPGSVGDNLAQPAPANALTLEQAIERALQNSEPVQIAEKSVEAARAQARAARAQRLPSLNLTGSYAYNGILLKQVLDFEGFPSIEDPAQNGAPIEIEFGTRHDYRGIAQIQWPIFTWWKTTRAVQAADQTVQAEMEALNAAKQQTALQTAENFYAALFADKAAETAQRALEQTKRRLNIVQLRIKAGAATQLDLLQANVAKANAGADAMRAENVHALAMSALAVSIGEDSDLEFTAVGDFQHKPFEEPLDDLIETALMNRHELKEAQALAEAAARGVQLAKAANKPNIALTWTGTWSDNEKQNAQSVWSTGVGVSFPIFDGFATKAQTQTAEARLAQARLAFQALERGVELETRQAYLAYQEAKASLEALNEAVQQAEEALRIANLSFENGLITSVELADIELQRTQTELNQLRASYGAASASARLARAVGGLLP